MSRAWNPKVRRSLPTGELGIGTPTADTEPATGAETQATARRQLPAIIAVLVLAVLAAAAAGAALGHEFWTTTRSASGLPTGGTSSNPFPGSRSGNGAFGGSGIFGNSGNIGGGSSASASGAPANAASIATRVDPGLVDVNSNFGYQSSAGAGTGIVLSSNGEVLTNNHVIDGATQITAPTSGTARATPRPLSATTRATISPFSSSRAPPV